MLLNTGLLIVSLLVVRLGLLLDHWLHGCGLIGLDLRLASGWWQGRLEPARLDVLGLGGGHL